MKVIKKLKLNEVYEIDGGFFYIQKQEVEKYNGKKYVRYFLKTSVTPEKMELIKQVFDNPESEKDASKVEGEQ